MALSLAALLVVAFAALVKCQDKQQAIHLTYGKFTDMTGRNNTPGQLGGECKGGYRFWANDDVSYIRLEDGNGNFVGSHTGVYEQDVRNALLAKNVTEDQIEETIKWYKNNPQIQQEEIGGKNAFLMTVYVTDPSIVCNDAPPSADRSSYLYVYHKGAADNNFFKVCRSDLSLTNAGWVQNSCVPQMGTHFRYLAGNDANFKCAQWTPVFLLFDNTTNVGWGFNFPGVIKNPRFENARKCAFLTIMDPMPTCVTQDYDNNGGYSSTHIYTNENPQSIGCPEKVVDPCPPKN